MRTYFVECGDCYGAQSDPEQCCNTCQEVKDEYAKKDWLFYPGKIQQCINETLESPMGIFLIQ